MSTSHSSPTMSDADFEAWLLQQFVTPHAALYQDYPAVFHSATRAITQWRRRYHGDPALWKRLFDLDRVRKEFIEAVPVIDAVVRLVENSTTTEEAGQKYTIVDLASGKGYLSMLLSEMLPPSKVERFLLMDKAWAGHNVKPLPHHMSAAHIYGADYYDSWPIPLNVSKQDLKSARQRRYLQTKFLNNDSRVILLGIHLCGTLSLKAVDLFNHNSSIEFFCLKPCCLPGMIHARRHEQFQFYLTAADEEEPVLCQPTAPVETETENNIELQEQQSSPQHSQGVCYHSFDSATVCMHGKWNKNVWKGPHRSTLQSFFRTWAKNLYLGIAIDTKCMENDNDNDNPSSAYQQGPIAHKTQKTVLVQTEGGYQNEFLFAQRCPTTNEVWQKLTMPSVKEDEEKNP